MRARAPVPLERARFAEEKNSSAGVEEVTADTENQKVIIKGKDLNPKKILEGIRKKYSKNVELISPKELPDTPNQNKPEPKKEEAQIKTVELKMNMHCEDCAKDIKKTIGKMEGVMTVETNKESSKVIVKGTVDAPKLVKYIKKKMGKNVEFFDKKQEKQSQPKESESKPANNKKDSNQDKENVISKYPPQYSLVHIYLDQTFSDDNVFSCSIM
ncbi:heavy metal-associated isoprenylated plant protein 8-like [Benincasa hispida]|uniref:heavy metal-associated isoprenylated plant protein 8-like n=1 Tax=Benincasa hispida TaxID=102211 RepID=UPI001901F3AC|nr:heavy metal-associated isoprenylated plant protein 8-like [Benincasa hispida]